MIAVSFTVDGLVVGKGRPRFRRTANFVTTYTDEKTVAYERQIRQAATDAFSSPLDGPLAVFLYVRIPIPSRYSKMRQKACLEQGERPCKKPDIDNIAKIFLDALNKLAYYDDVQVVNLHVKKVYSSVAGVDVTIRQEVL